MPAPLYVVVGSERLTASEIARRVGISHSTAADRIRKGLDLLSPPATKKEAAMRNPDPFGWSWRRNGGKG